MAHDQTEGENVPPHRCADCGVDAPRTETNYTLISTRYGWRLSLSRTPDGRKEAVWRCPACWEIFRRRR